MKEQEIKRESLCLMAFIFLCSLMIIGISACS
jgi:hypothetical protein